ncbi:hypothetical protein BH11VER1_BH11VER1_21090 [soil metagenome]
MNLECLFDPYKPSDASASVGGGRCVGGWCTLAVVGMLGLSSLSAQNVLPDEQRTNGAGTLKAIADLQSKVTSSSVQLGRERDKTLAGIIVSPDGYILTQASDTESLNPMHVFLPDGSNVEARSVTRDEKLDLLLVKIERTGLQAVAWGESLSLKAGQWLTSLTNRGRDVRLGVVSASRRSIPNSGAVLGVRFNADDDDAGVLIEEVAEDGPATKAGLRAEDLIVAVNGKKVSHNKDVSNIIATFHPGDLVKVRYQRKGKETECEVRLASKSKVLMNWTGDDFGNHGTSLRTDNFPEVLQHDLPLNPSDMGGAVYDLQGRAVGLNISRVDRVTNYALPVELFQKELAKWIKADQEKK